MSNHKNFVHLAGLYTYSTSSSPTAIFGISKQPSVFAFYSHKVNFVRAKQRIFKIHHHSLNSPVKCIFLYSEMREVFPSTAYVRRAYLTTMTQFILPLPHSQTKDKTTNFVKYLQSRRPTTLLTIQEIR